MIFRFVFGFAFVLLCSCLWSCQSAPKQHESRDSIETFTFQDMPSIEGTDLKLGGFSGLVYEGFSKIHGEYGFTTLTDRGPNSELRKDASSDTLRPFVAPNFVPLFVRFSFDPKKKQLSEITQIPMRRFDGSPMTGLPNIAGLDETPIDKQGKRLSLDKFGVDTEGLVHDPDDGTYWAVEEYRPSILHFDKDAKLIQRWIPKDTATGTGVPQLPKWYATRVKNHGFEGVAIDGENVVAFLQGALEGDDQITRILSVSKRTGLPVAEYAYAFEPKEEGRKRADKISDAVNIGPGRFLVIEQNGRTDESATHSVFEIDVNGATVLTKYRELSHDIFCLEGVPSKDCIVPVKKKLVADLVALGLRGIDKMEGLAVIDEQTLALVNDNDFDVAHSGAQTSLFLVHLAKPLRLH